MADNGCTVPDESRSKLPQPLDSIQGVRELKVSLGRRGKETTQLDFFFESGRRYFEAEEWKRAAGRRRHGAAIAAQISQSTTCGENFRS